MTRRGIHANLFPAPPKLPSMHNPWCSYPFRSPTPQARTSLPAPVPALGAQAGVCFPKPTTPQVPRTTFLLA